MNDCPVNEYYKLTNGLRNSSFTPSAVVFLCQHHSHALSRLGT